MRLAGCLLRSKIASYILQNRRHSSENKFELAIQDYLDVGTVA